MRIVHLCAPAPVGGLERVVTSLAAGLAKLGHDVHVLAVRAPGASVVDSLCSLEKDGVRLHTVEVTGNQYLREIRTVSELLRHLAPDVLHTHGYRSDLMHGGRARRMGIATVSTLHGSSRMGGASHFFEWVQERALRRFDAVVAVSRPLRRELLERGVSADRIHLIPNGWTPPDRCLSRSEARAALGLDDATLVFGWIGRHIPIKGCDVFVDALGLLREHEWIAVIVGAGPETESLKGRVVEHGIENRVRFTGAIADAGELMPAFDVFAMSSRSEGTPMVLLEAMGAGVPVVVTGVGGVPDVVEDGTSGWVVPPEDSARLGGALRDAMTHRDERERRGRAAADTVRQVYDADVWLHRHVECYRAIR